MSSIRDCRSLLPMLGPYADRELGAEDAWAVEKHIATCAVCAKVVADFSATARLLRSLPSHELSADFDARLAARLADVTLTPRRPRLSDRLRWSWQARSGRPVWAPVALALVVPTFAFVAYRTATKPNPAVVQGADHSALDVIAGDHVRAASIEPLGSTASLMLASAPASGGESDGF
jgi:anti-sigma factor RsiW